MLLWLLGSLIRYDVCLFKGDDSLCTSEKEYRFDVSNMQQFESYAFPQASEITLNIATDMRNGADIFINLWRFWRMQPKINIRGIGGKRLFNINVSHCSDFEIHMSDLNLKFVGGTSWNVHSLNMKDCLIAGSVPTFSAMNFVSDFVSLKDISNIQSWNYVFKNYRGELKDKKINLLEKPGSKQYVTFDSFDTNTLLGLYGNDLVLNNSVTFSSSVQVYLFVNHTNKASGLALENFYSRLPEGRSLEMVVSLASATSLSLLNSFSDRDLVIHAHGENSIFMSTSSVSASLLVLGNGVKVSSSGCTLKKVTLTAVDLAFESTESGVIEVNQLEVRNSAAITAGNGGLTVKINDITTKSDTAMVTCDGDAMFVFKSWTSPHVRRSVTNLRIEDSESIVGLALDRIATTTITGSLEIPEKKTFYVEMQNKDPREDEIEEHFETQYEFLCAKKLPKTLDMRIATSDVRGFSVGASVLEVVNGECIGLKMTKHVKDVNNVFCLGESSWCPKNSTVFKTAEEANNWTSYLDLSIVPNVTFVVTQEFPDFVLDFAGYSGDVKVTGRSINTTTVKFTGALFSARTVVLENIDILVTDMDTWDGTIKADLTLTKSTFSSEFASKCYFAQGTTLSIPYNQAGAFSAELPNVILEDMIYDAAYFDKNEIIFKYQNETVQGIANARSVGVRYGSTMPLTLTGPAAHQLYISGSRARHTEFDLNNESLVSFDTLNGALITHSTSIPISFADSQWLSVSSTKSSRVSFPSSITLNSELELDSGVEEATFSNLVMNSNARISKSKDTKLSVDKLAITGRLSLDDLTVTHALNISSSTTLSIADLSFTPDTLISVHYSSTIPLVTIGSNTNRALKITAVQEDTFTTPGVEIPLLCFTGRDCTNDAMTVHNSSADIELACSNRCAVLRAKQQREPSVTWAVVVCVWIGIMFAGVLAIALALVFHKKKQEERSTQVLLTLIEKI